MSVLRQKEGDFGGSRRELSIVENRCVPEKRDRQPEALPAGHSSCHKEEEKKSTGAWAKEKGSACIKPGKDNGGGEEYETKTSHTQWERSRAPFRRPRPISESDN